VVATTEPIPSSSPQTIPPPSIILLLSYTITIEIYNGLDLGSDVTELILLETVRRNKKVMELMQQVIKNRKVIQKIKE